VSDPGSATATDPPNEPVFVATHDGSRYRPGLEPSVYRTHGGAFVVDLGASSDEFREELRQKADEVERLIADSDRTMYRLYTGGGSLSNLFATEATEVTALDGLVLWILAVGSAPLWLRQPEPLVEAIRRVAGCRPGATMAPYVFLHMEGHPSASAPPGTSELARRLSDAGVRVLGAPEDECFLFEVHKPDATLGALHWRAVPQERVPESSNEIGAGASLHCVARAPRLHRLVLALGDEPAHENARPLFEELLSRDIGLLVLCDRNRNLSLWSFDGGEKNLIKAFPDLASLYRAVNEMNLAEDAYTWGLVSPRELFGWVDAESIAGVALNAYRGPADPKYFVIGSARAKALASGHIPDPT
jgi:hypothetical protein